MMIELTSHLFSCCFPVRLLFLEELLLSLWPTCVCGCRCGVILASVRGRCASAAMPPSDVLTCANMDRNASSLSLGTKCGMSKPRHASCEIEFWQPPHRPCRSGEGTRCCDVGSVKGEYAPDCVLLWL